jgi:hypothetical protein
MRGAPWLMSAALLGAAACMPEARLQPLPAARTVAGDEAAAVAEEAGVRLVADGDAWRGNPGNLERSLTPVEVRLENRSGRPLSVKYEHFTLVGGSRFRYSAVSPLELGGALALLEPASGTGGAGVGVGVELGWGWGRHHPYGWGPWPGWYDPFWGPYYPGPRGYPACQEPLPTRDMLTQALPEGTLEEGGTLAGFLYFQGVAEREKAVTLRARLVDARNGETFGVLDIPFEVRN